MAGGEGGLGVERGAVGNDNARVRAGARPQGMAAFDIGQDVHGRRITDNPAFVERQEAELQKTALPQANGVEARPGRVHVGHTVGGGPSAGDNVEMGEAQ